MTREQARQLYESVFHHWRFGDSEWDSIHEEMTAVVAAKSDRAAGKVIEWWDCWSPRETATAAARKLREEWKRRAGSAPRRSIA